MTTTSPFTAVDSMDPIFHHSGTHTAQSHLRQENRTKQSLFADATVSQEAHLGLLLTNNAYFAY